MEACIHRATSASSHIIDDADPVAELARLSRSHHERAILPKVPLHAEALDAALVAAEFDPTPPAKD
ncbi:hypothetical protein DK427_13045 [Methylobacterium radiodurans]|uniref:Uncharacterized protein n=2 Tax=Methylobacterium radiodurans TaxID=2202828 RepID=A0A2U8VTF2_9HYPH|nr:hypothetical protein DK427_13045 [Methylobacterium radiodurans]